MKALIVLSAVITLAGCQKEAEFHQTAGTGGFNVEKLFTVEGCSVYRFKDYRTVYYTNCSGSTQTQQSCGKNCSYTHTVSGGGQ